MHTAQCGKTYFRNLCLKSFASSMMIFVSETDALFILVATELRIKFENDLLHLCISIMVEVCISIYF